MAAGALEGPERQLSVAVDGNGARSRSARESWAYFLEGSATTNSASRMRVRRSCQYFSGRSTVQSSAYHRVSTSTAARLHDDSSSRRWVTLASGRPCAPPRATRQPECLSCILHRFYRTAVVCKANLVRVLSHLLGHETLRERGT